MKLLGLIVLLIVFIVYRTWFFGSGTLSSGDWTYLFKENIAEFSFFSKDWIIWLTPYYQITAKIFVEKIGLTWEMTERLFWFWPFLIVSIFSSYYLTRSFVGVLIYTTNTYILMAVSGGQMGVAMGYAIAPFFLGRLINDKVFFLRSSISTGVILAIQMMFDPRIAYACMIAAFLYVMLFKIKKIFYFIITCAVGLLFNSWWILQFLQGKIPQGVESFRNVEGFDFLSFADFPHAFSLLHPNWPENIFGKTYFLQPEFLLLPILAYSSLLFISKIRDQKSKMHILYFTLLGLVGVFLAKGANEPFGFLNQWMFQYVPGMSMFRDPSKFYILIILSYSILIPFSISNFKLKIRNAFLIFTILYLVFLIRPAIFGQLTGTFKTYQIPKEYIALKEFLKNDLSFAPVLWIPQRQRFGFYSKNHPAFEASDKNLAAVLQQQKVKYVIVPFDSQKELFIKDRRYDERLYSQTLERLGQLSRLNKKQTFGKIVVFEVN